ncbi:hypothetical protein CTheo_7040 [Ceratobasidium theobromae]|uniref:Transmembrane protein n=1 Tax=Ceratobasidium theobromae TaxID=1582974 RepID=A0A5N5QDJ7_9AGAM|nr:hypothetical protein CTheo_7040 [Ceratobasidium theobromae]
MIFTGIVLAATVVGLTGLDFSLSQSCQNAAAAVLVGPAGTCLGVSGLVNIATTPANQSIITPVDNWLTATCAQPACTNSILEAAFNNITTGCQSDLNATGIDSQTAAAYVSGFEEWYPVGREVACLKDTNANNALCVTSTLKAFETYLGVPLSLQSIDLLTAKLATSTEVPKTLICTPCIQASYALIRPHLKDADRGTVDSVLSSNCGSNFTDGTTPASIKQSAATSNTNAAVSSLAVWSSATSLLVGVAGVVALAL